MGTNYYLVSPVCKCCGHRSHKYHIGKTSFGWVFLWQAYEDDNEMDSIDRTIDMLPPISSRKTWEDILLTRAERGWEVMDEYGTLFSAQEFLAHVDKWNSEERNNRSHIEYAENNPLSKAYHSTIYSVDEEGNEFSTGRWE